MDLITQSQGKQQLWSNQVSSAIVDISAIYNYRKCSMVSFMLRISRRNFNCNKDKTLHTYYTKGSQLQKTFHDYFVKSSLEDLQAFTDHGTLEASEI
ncbi:hypothetical protein J010_00365 [Cryptococcus neoformans]|nr:hypothetical protein C355_00382 [Cryptococcus neoformans var. grubii Th84]OXH19462.1 hypothetical protein J010_00365 [Cryptococcus neoformans var. grubii]OXH38831.1 hypothetical protein J009_00386 [Cryptococcus neoformans var. grubii]OXH59744.1 hypothetical protein J003_00388 [Cryptococcus neoformans var. grubii]OXH60399.1 hypothetical protein J004_00413 [Cryptococcus neoformans var. grubii]